MFFKFKTLSFAKRKNIDSESHLKPHQNLLIGWLRTSKRLNSKENPALKIIVSIAAGYTNLSEQHSSEILRFNTITDVLLWIPDKFLTVLSNDPNYFLAHFTHILFQEFIENLKQNSIQTVSSESKFRQILSRAPKAIDAPTVDKRTQDKPDEPPPKKQRSDCSEWSETDQSRTSTSKQGGMNASEFQPDSPTESQLFRDFFESSDPDQEGPMSRTPEPFFWPESPPPVTRSDPYSAETIVVRFDFDPQLSTDRGGTPEVDFASKAKDPPRDKKLTPRETHAYKEKVRRDTSRRDLDKLHEATESSIPSPTIRNVLKAAIDCIQDLKSEEAGLRRAIQELRNTNTQLTLWVNRLRFPSEDSGSEMEGRLERFF